MSAASRTRAIEVYEALLSEAPRYVRMDEALFYLAETYTAQHDLTTHPLSALLDCPATLGPTAAAFALGKLPSPPNEGGGHPAAVFRLGFAPPAARAPRLPLDELIVLPSEFP